MQGKKIRNIIIVVLCLILFAYIAIIVGSAVGGKKVSFFSINFYIMSSDAADSDIKDGDLVVAKNVKVEDITSGDNIIYKRNNSMIVKKVKSVKNENGKVNLYIEDDNVIASESRENMQVMGKIIYKIRGFGNFALYVQSPIGALNILIIFVCVFILIKKISQNIQGSKAKKISETEENTKK